MPPTVAERIRRIGGGYIDRAYVTTGIRGLETYANAAARIGTSTIYPPSVPGWHTATEYMHSLRSFGPEAVTGAMERAYQLAGQTSQEVTRAMMVGFIREATKTARA